MTSKINVNIRIRPGPDSVTSVDGNTLTVGNKIYTFDRIYDTNSDQQTLFSDIQPMLDNTISGYNSTIFVYGQTGSGKTYTMGMNTEGLTRKDGIMPVSLWYLLGQMKGEWSMNMSFVEIYNEEVRDLFGNKAEIHLRERNGEVQMAGVKEIEIKSEEEAFEYLVQASRERITKSTKMNMTSSRSHAVLTINIKQKVEKKFLISHVRFIDLAGSERAKRTGVSRDLRTPNGTFIESKESTMRESISINSGLLALGNVISALSKKMKHIPFRDSKLTRLLQPSLTGSYNTVMIACISPCSVDMYETQNTLKYALRATNISLSVKRNVSVDLGQMNVMELNKEIHNLREENMRLRENSSFRSLKLRIDILEKENEKLKEELNRIKSLRGQKEILNNSEEIQEVSFREPDFNQIKSEENKDQGPSKESNNRGFSEVIKNIFSKEEIIKDIIGEEKNIIDEENIKGSIAVDKLVDENKKSEYKLNGCKKVKVEERTSDPYKKIFEVAVESLHTDFDAVKLEKNIHMTKSSKLAFKIVKKIKGPAIQAIEYHNNAVFYGTLDGFLQSYDPVGDTELGCIAEPMAIKCLKSSGEFLVYGMGRTLKIHAESQQLSCTCDADISCVETQGPYIFTGHENGTVQVRDIRYLAPDAIFKRIPIHRGTIFGIIATASGIYTASRDHSVGLIQQTQQVYTDNDCIDTKTLQNGEPPATRYKKNLLFPPHYDSVHFVLEYADSIISGSRDCSIKQWMGGQVAKTISYAHNSWIKAGVSMGDFFITGCKGGDVMAWRFADGALKRIAKSRVESVQCMARAGGTIAVGCARSLNILRIRD